MSGQMKYGQIFHKPYKYEDKYRVPTMIFDIRAEIEALDDPTTTRVRRLFKKIRRAVRDDISNDPRNERLRAIFDGMRRWERRDHVAALRLIYQEVLPDELRDRITAHSLRRGGRPDA